MEVIKKKKYKQSLQDCKFGIWIGCSESQGIGLQEALSTNLPLIVLDAVSLFDSVSYSFPKELSSIKTSSAPYFDDRCGIKIKAVDELEDAITTLQNNIQKLQAKRVYIRKFIT
jgi:uncharacterized small protein (DUF1192 family)